jgi:hypothetical protein
MMKRLLVVGIVAFLAALSLNAAPLSVSWADGKVDLQKGSSWVAVSMGDDLDSSAVIRLGPGASVELTDGKHKVSLTAAGTYSLDSLLKQGAIASKNKGGALDKLGKLVDPKASVSGGGTVAAVRGAAIEPTSDTVTWESDSVDVSAVMDEGRKLVRDGDFTGAAKKFDTAAQAADGEDKDSAQYAESWALAAGDNTAQAVKILRTMPSSGTWAAPRALLLARLDIDSGAKNEAISVLNAGVKSKIFVGDDVDLANSLLTEASAK